jgi:uncharacterized protein (DUF305 family)
MQRRLILLCALLAAVALTAAACSSSGSRSGSSTSTPTDHNQADVTFAREMIPHHQQAIEMAQLAESRAGSPRVRELATKIEAAQGPEIERLTSWLKSWGVAVATGSMPMGDHGAHGTAPGGASSDAGMMSPNDIATLRPLSGNGFDEAFLNIMIKHHEGAIAMANTESAVGQYAPAITMARAIASSQQSEVDQMKALLQTLG